MRSQLPQQAGDGYYQHGGEDLREKRHGKCWRLGISSTDDVVGGWGQSKHGRSPSIQLLEVSDPSTWHITKAHIYLNTGFLEGRPTIWRVKRGQKGTRNASWGMEIMTPVSLELSLFLIITLI